MPIGALAAIEQLLSGCAPVEPVRLPPGQGDISLSTTAAASYRARFRKVLEFIDANLDEDLTVEQLAGVAAFSKYHFHRQFSELLGIGVYKYVQLRRLKRASYRLAFGRDQVLDIAVASGYEGPESFARAFRKSFGQTPSGFRRAPQWESWHAAYRPSSELRSEHMKPVRHAADVRIVAFRETKVAVLEHRGDPRRIGNSIREFIEWRRENGLPPRVSATFNIVYDDAAEVAPEDYRLDLGAAVDRDVEPNRFGVVTKTIPAGRCAVLRHSGSDDTLEASVRYLYFDWLPQSGEELRDFPLYFERVEFFPQVPENEAITDVFLPLK